MKVRISDKGDVERIQPDVKKGLERGGRKREDIDLNLWLWCAPGVDEATAIEDARPTIAFYAGVAQYEEYFAARGLGAEAKKLQEGVQRGDCVGVRPLGAA